MNITKLALALGITMGLAACGGGPSKDEARSGYLLASSMATGFAETARSHMGQALRTSAPPSAPSDDNERQPLLGFTVVGGRDVEGVGEGLLAGRSHHYTNDRQIRDIPHFTRVRFAAVYPGIDLLYYGTRERRLEYDFVVAPRTDLGLVNM